MKAQHVMPSHISDRLYEHTNAWTNAYSVPGEEQLAPMGQTVHAILISNISPLFKEMKQHVYFQAESLEDGHVGSFNGIPVFIPNLPFKSGAPIRLITGINRQAGVMLERFK